MKNIENQKTLITGASGSLGKQLIFEMGKRGIKPVAQLRQSSNAVYIDKMKLEKRYADLQNQNELGKLVEGIDNIIHTAAWVNFRKDRLAQFTGINTIAAVNLFREAQNAGVKRFVHVSTIATVGAIRRKGEYQPIRGMLDENAEYNLGKFSIPYFTTKRAAETELTKLAGDGTTELIIVNPPSHTSTCNCCFTCARPGIYQNPFFARCLNNFSLFMIP